MSAKVQDLGNPVHDWMAEQTRRHGCCHYVFTKVPFNASRYSVLYVLSGDVVSTGHSLGVAKARANKLNMQVSASTNEQKREQ